MDFAVSRRADCVHVGDIEQPRIRSTGKARRQRLPDGRMRAVAAGEIGRFTDLLRAVRSDKTVGHRFLPAVRAEQRHDALVNARQPCRALHRLVRPFFPERFRLGVLLVFSASTFFPERFMGNAASLSKARPGGFQNRLQLWRVTHEQAF
jgi:hypothetical protein